MYYLQLALLALGAILLSNNIVISCSCALIFLLITWKNKNLNAKKAIICVVVFLVFFIRGAYVKINNTTCLENTDNIEVTLKVEDRAYINGNYLKGVAKLNKEKVLFNYILKSEEEKEFFKKEFYGGKLLVKAKIEDIAEKKNFYSFDYKKYNKNRGVFKNIKVDEIKNIEKSKNFIDKVKSIRLIASSRISQTSNFDKSGYMEALIFGDKSYLSKDEVNNYRNLGTSHLLSISGLHLTALIGTIYLFLKRFKFSESFIEKVILVVVPFYIIISGFSPSVLRAGGMIILYIIFRKRDFGKLESLCCTFLLLLFYNPLYIFDIGFELSFVVTFCLIMSKDYLKIHKNKLKLGYRVSLVSAIASFPILVANFYTFSYISIFSNVVLVPIFTLIIFPLVTSGYLVSITSFNIFEHRMKPLLNFAFYLFDYVQSLFLKIRVLVLGNKSIIIILLLSVGCLVILIYLNKKKFLHAYILIVIVLCTAITTSFFSSSKLEEIKLGNEKIYYVREGRKNLLINTANSRENFYTDFRKKDSMYDIMNEYNLLLNYEGKYKFDYLLLTTNKSNKVGLANELIGKKMIEELIIVDKVEKNLEDTIKLAKFMKIKIRILKSGESFSLGEVHITNDGDKVKVRNSNKEFDIEVNS